MAKDAHRGPGSARSYCYTVVTSVKELFIESLWSLARSLLPTLETFSPNEGRELSRVFREYDAIQYEQAGPKHNFSVSTLSKYRLVFAVVLLRFHDFLSEAVTAYASHSMSRSPL